MNAQDLLEFVVDRVPGRAREIQRECGRSESFRTLCEDFYTCAEALARWETSDEPLASERAVEYQQSLGELEQEIEEWLQRSDP